MATHSGVLARDGGAWWAAVYGVAQGQTRLKRLSSSRGSLAAASLPGFAAHRPLPSQRESTSVFCSVPGAPGRGSGNAHAHRDPARAERAAGRARGRTTAGEGDSVLAGMAGLRGRGPRRSGQGVSARISRLPGHAGAGR